MKFNEYNAVLILNADLSANTFFQINQLFV